MRVRVTAELTAPAEIRPEVGEEIEVEKKEMPNGRVAYVAERGGPHKAQIAIFPEECEVVA